MSHDLSKLLILKNRALMFKKVRAFFEERNILEVDCPALLSATNVDQYIDVMQVPQDTGPTRFLHTSPEHCMKRLIARGCGDIYQMSHTFRLGEYGRIHNPEFTMIEWYRLGMDFENFIDETCAFVKIFLTDLPINKYTYRDLLNKYAKIDCFDDPIDLLRESVIANNLASATQIADWDRDTLLNLLMSFIVEPHLGANSIDVVYGYPGSQASLSLTEEQDGHLVAKRFEIYHHGIELANGFDELLDAKEYRLRFEEENRGRQLINKPALPIDELLINDLAKNPLPPCCGVAAGFDRLLMLQEGKSSLADILPIPFTSC